MPPGSNSILNTETWLYAKKFLSVFPKKISLTVTFLANIYWPGSLESKIKNAESHI